jgi:hypothetical protein
MTAQLGTPDTPVTRRDPACRADSTARIHSALGCLFIGCEHGKDTGAAREGAARMGAARGSGIVFAALILTWFMSAYQFFSTFGIKR